MKKIICFLLTILILASPGITAYADEESDLTPDLIIERLLEGDEASETAEDQAANGALRLAEMVVALDNIGIETQGEADHLNKILDMLFEVDVPEESFERKLAAGTMKTFEALMIFQQQIDPDGQFEDNLQQVLDSFLANDEKVGGAKQQAVNGLYHSVLTTSLIVRGLSRTQAAAKQIDAELEAFGKADKDSTGSDLEQLLLGSETLFRMLTAVVSVLDSGGGFSDAIRELSENTYAADAENDDAIYRLANWLYGCVYMTDLIAQEIEA